MKSYDAIFFDLYSTVLHFDYSILPEVEYQGKPLRTTSVEVHRQVRERFGLDCPFERFLHEMLETRQAVAQLWGEEKREFPSLRRFEILCRRLGWDQPGAAAFMVEVHMDQMFQMMRLPEENRRVLDRLREIPLALASNFDHAETVYRALRTHGVEGHFQHVFISVELGWRKPGTNFFDAIVARSGYSPSRCVFVGDDPVCDLWGASQHGFTVAWLEADGVEPPVEPKWRLKRLPDLLGALGLEQMSTG